MKSYGYAWRLLTILMASTYPYLCLLIHGYEPSLSSYWQTPLQPVFILANIATAYYFLQMKNWEIPGLLLILLTVFSVDLYGELHNVFAIAFFLTCLVPLWKTKRYVYIFYLYILGGIFMSFSLLIGEIICITGISLFHLLLLTKFKTIKEYNDNNLHQ